jgi:hypothetical protein
VFVAFPRKLSLVKPFIERSWQSHAGSNSAFDFGAFLATSPHQKANLIIIGPLMREMNKQHLPHSTWMIQD